MSTQHFSSIQSGAVLSTNLSAVTSATTGDSLETRDFSKKTVIVQVSGNTGAVTVDIEASLDGSTWFVLDTKTYAVTNGNDVYYYNNHLPFMRVVTSTHSAATVSSLISGGRY